ncbi:MAG: tryptophanase [Armatimonadetes bacterium]|nr:tryptophanase [Armatimonadota bacterium]
MPEIIEPFRIKAVEPIRSTTTDERCQILADAHYNPFLIHADDVLIDLLTDSGTSAMSAAQWAAVMVGDESYAGSRSFYRFQEKVQEIFGFNFVIPTHQGRAAEKLLATLLGGPGHKIPNNNHFDTTRANIEYSGAEAIDLVCSEAKDLGSDYPFKGNIDIPRLREFLAANRGDVPFGMVTITNNAGGGQPVSMANLREISATYREFGVPFIIDSCRFAENAWFIKQREPGYGHKSPKEIAQEIFSLADGATMSLKKDGFGNIGGFLALNEEKLAEQCRNLLILTEGFPTYGGMAGRDMEALAVGLEETLQEDYLRYRVRTVEYVVERLNKLGVQTVRPAGGHAVYVDARSFYPQLPQSAFPAQVLVCELYRHGGIRGVEIGSAMFGRSVDGVEIPADKELVRLAMPRRVYTQAHMNYMIEVFEVLLKEREQVSGLKILKQAPILRHFTAWFEPLN